MRYDRDVLLHQARKHHVAYGQFMAIEGLTSAYQPEQYNSGADNARAPTPSSLAVI